MGIKNSYKFVLLVIGMVAVALSSCKTHQTTTYMVNADSLGTSINRVDYSLKLVPSDQLKVMISSLVPEATAAFKTMNAVYTTTDGSQTDNQSTTLREEYSLYVVDKNGNIEVPVLGTMKVEGLSTLEVADLLRRKVSEHVQDPIVDVKLANFRVNVLGEVKTPGAKTVKTERYTIFDALADAGDLTMYGRRDNVLLVREDAGVRSFHRLNLNDANIVNSQYYYLKQNDVVYVEPNAVRVVNSEYNQNNSFKISIISTVVSAISVIASLVIALAINK